MRCCLCLKRRPILHRMNQTGEPGLFACPSCAPNFWERYLARQAQRRIKRERSREARG